MSTTAAVWSYLQYYCLVREIAPMRSWHHKHTDFSLCITSHMNAHTASQECAQKKAGTCKEWLQPVWEKECVCVCVCSAHVCSVMSSCEKKALYKYARPVKISCPGWGSGPRHSHFFYVPATLFFQLNYIYHYYQLLTFNIILYAYVWFKKKRKKKRVFTYCMCERKRNLLCSPAVILSKNKTNTLLLPSNHPPYSANIQAKLHSATCLSKRNTHTHSQLPGRERKGELHHLSIKAVTAAGPWKETADTMRFLWLTMV